MNSLYTEACTGLQQLYAPGEARAIARALLEDAFAVSMNDVYADKVRQFSAEETMRFRAMLQRLEKGEPVQYVTGRASFGNFMFNVGKGVLVPRPETLELAQWAAAECKPGANIMDMGTGSGCIAVFLAKSIPGAHVTAIDISPKALETARRNAALYGADIRFAKADVLDLQPCTDRKFDLVISNPPYVCESEKAGMERNVLDYEPAEALFVSDDNPLVFYEAIAGFASRSLSPQGAAMVEINRRFPEETAEVFRRAGFYGIQTRTDAQGKPRMIKATLR